jgi:hypothetical protein
MINHILEIAGEILFGLLGLIFMVWLVVGLSKCKF